MKRKLDSFIQTPNQFIAFTNCSFLNTRKNFNKNAFFDYKCTIGYDYFIVVNDSNILCKKSQYKQIMFCQKAKFVNKYKLGFKIKPCSRIGLQNKQKIWQKALLYKKTDAYKHFSIDIYDLNENDFLIGFFPFYSLHDKTNFSKSLIKKGLLKPLVFTTKL